MTLTREPGERVRPSPPIRVGVFGLFAALLVALPLVLAPRAEGFVYWAGGAAIGRADLDGTKVNDSFISAIGPADLAVDARHVYWTACEDPSCAREAIGRANLDGSDVDRRFITDTGRRPQGIAVDAKHVYWTAADPHVVARANLDGTNVDRSFITMSDYQGIYEKSGVAVDAHHVYWTQIEAPNGATSIGRADLEGVNVERSFIPNTFGATDVAVDAEHIYWTTPGFGTTPGFVGRANLDGSDVEPSFISAAGGPRVTGVAVDAHHVYWGQHTGYPSFSGSIGRANLDGTGVDQAFVGGQYGLVSGGLAADGLTDARLRGNATAKRTQKARGRKVRIAVKLKARERLSAKATGKIKVNPTYKLRPKTVELDTNETRKLTLKPKRRAAKRIVAALKRGKKAKAKLAVKLTDPTGNRDTQRLRVRLKRG